MKTTINTDEHTKDLNTWKDTRVHGLEADIVHVAVLPPKGSPASIPIKIPMVFLAKRERGAKNILKFTLNFKGC